MATVGKEGDNYRILFVGGDKKRHTVRLGKTTKKTAESIKLRIEAILESQFAKTSLDSETAAWLGGISDDLHDKLSRAGLVSPRQSAKLGAFLDDYLDRRRADSKPATCTHLRTVRNDLVDFFGADLDLRSIDESKADDFRHHLLNRTPKLSKATAARRLTAVKMFFVQAARLKLIDRSPFDGLLIVSSVPEDRRRYISVDDAEKIIAVANPTWRIIVALSRFAGLRCPSEVLSLRWEHIDFIAGRMTVTSPKTEHKVGKAFRVVPIFARLRPILEEAYELAEAGEIYVVGGEQGDRYRNAAQGVNGWVNANLRTTFEKLIRRAGVEDWPKPFHNMRSSCETDLVREHPIHVVCAWIGNSPAIASRHYLQTLDKDFAKAVAGNAAQNPAHSEANKSEREKTTKSSNPEISGKSEIVNGSAHSCNSEQMGVTGLEPNEENPIDSSDNLTSPELGGTESGTLAAIVDSLTSEERSALIRLLLKSPQSSQSQPDQG